MSENSQDKALKDSFPASDPPANSGITGAEPPGSPTKPSQQRDIEEQPTGTPTSDRHGAEIAYHGENETKP